jgi:hypothetical protein
MPESHQSQINDEASFAKLAILEGIIKERTINILGDR